MVTVCWHAQGLTKKFGRTKFGDMINNMDKIGVVETWMEESEGEFWLC
jgi:hypothetical protein